MTLKICNKYMYLEVKGKQIEYFEHFTSKKPRQSVIEIATVSNSGDIFLKKNNSKVLDVKVYWFGRKIKYKPIFVRGTDSVFDYLVLIKE